MFRARFAITTALVLLPLCACVHTQPAAPPQKVDLTPLEEKIDETNQKLDKMYQRVSVLQLMVDAQQRAIQDLKTAQNKNRPAAAGNFTEAPVAAPPDTGRTPMPEPPPAVTEQPLPRAADTTPQAPLSAPPIVTGKETAPQAPAPAKSYPDADALYGAAMALYKDGKYNEAAELFQTYTARYPQQTLADNALYWSGECRYALKDYAGAIASFQSVLKRYPNGNKVPDALLKLGFSHLSAGDRDAAVDYLKKTIKNYPFSPAATKAEAKLRQL